MELAIILGAVFLLMVLIAAEVPVAFALGGSGLVGLVLIDGVPNTVNWLESLPFQTTSNYALTLIPMFILMGLFAGHSGMLDDVYDLAYRVLRRLPGGLPAAASLAGALFGGISGSSVADAATIGRLSIGEMAARGYEKAFAAAVVAAGGTAAILIPPSIVLVIYGILTGESVGLLLLAGIIPGLITAVVEVGLIVWLAPRFFDPFKADTVTASQERRERVTQRRGRTIRHWPYLGPALAALLMSTVLGGIYTGLFTPTEAGAAGAAASLLCSVIYVLRRRYEGDRSVTLRSVVFEALRETGGLTASVFALLVGGALFTRFLVTARVPNTVTEWILGLDLPPHLVVAIFLIMVLPLGMLLDGLSLLLIVTPLAYPVVTAMGFDGIWLGVLLVKLIEVGLITPPVGLNVFVVSGLDSEIEVPTVFRRVTPFVVTDIVLTATLFAFPALITWLPGLSEVQG